MEEGQQSVHIALGFLITGKQRHLTKTVYNCVRCCILNMAEKVHGCAEKVSPQKNVLQQIEDVKVKSLHVQTL